MTNDLIDPLSSVRQYLAAEKSEATRRAYVSSFKQFEAWCTHAGEAPLPATALVVARYLASLADDGRKASTVRRVTSAISYFHRAGGHESPTRAEGVKAVLRGIFRKIGSAPTRKTPATAELIVTMIEKLPATLAGMRDRALLLLGFSAALRRSELVALTVEDLDRQQDGMYVTIRRSKTDQAGQGQVIPVPRGTRLKPMEALETWLTAASITTGPLFREVDRYGHVGTEPLATRSVARIIKLAVKRTGADESTFSGHSLRTGFVTSALESGADLFRVMDITRHKTVEQLKVYDRRARGFRNHAGKDIL